MSLKGFHIVFVTICTMLCAFLVLWAYLLNQEPSLLSSILGIVGISGVLLMPLYGVYFYRKAARLVL